MPNDGPGAALKRCSWHRCCAPIGGAWDDAESKLLAAVGAGLCGGCALQPRRSSLAATARPCADRLSDRARWGLHSDGARCLTPDGGGPLGRWPMGLPDLVSRSCAQCDHRHRFDRSCQGAAGAGGELGQGLPLYR